MSIVVLLATNLLLLVLFVQDMRYRAVSWIIYPTILLLAVLALFLKGADYGLWFVFSTMNLGFLLLNMSLLMLWFLWKGLSVSIVLKDYIGLGDLLFFVLMALILPFPAFPVVFVCTLVGALITGLLFFRNSTVPLAGLQAIGLAAAITLNYFEAWPPIPSNLIFA